MQPYEFGYLVGSGGLTKQAFGGSMYGLNPFHQDNTVARTIGYMVPGVSTVQSAQDLYTNISQGNVLGSLGSAGMMALGLVPGGAFLGGLGRASKGLIGAGKALAGGANAGRMAQAVGKGLQGIGTAGRYAQVGMGRANQIAKGVNTSMSQAIQKRVPLMQTSWKPMGSVGGVNLSMPMNPVKSLTNAAIRNPINTIGMTMGSQPLENRVGQVGGQMIQNMPPPNYNLSSF